MNKKKLFDLINDEILDLEIKGSKSEIIIDKTKELTERLCNKGVVFQPFKPGDDVYVIERDESDKAVDYSGYMCIAVSENAVVLSSYIDDLSALMLKKQRHLTMLILMLCKRHLQNMRNPSLRKSQTISV